MPLLGRGKKKEKEEQKRRELQQEQEQKQQNASPKAIPRKYFDCPMSDLITLVSSMLQELVKVNDGLPFDADQLTRFHSRSPPGISIYDYLVRVTKFCTLEKSIMLSIIYYIDLLCTTYKTFNINSLTVHRFIITAAMVGSKGLCDSFCTNSHYAKVGGISRMELNVLEVEFLVRVDYQIVPDVEVLDKYYERLVMRMQERYQFATPPASEVSSKEDHTATPSELAQQENRQNKSSALKRPSITDVIPNATVHHPDEPQSEPIIESPSLPKRTKHV